MKFISSKLHGIIDYLVVVFLLASPTLFGFTGLLAGVTYALGVVHLLLTLLTNFRGGVFKVIPFTLHGVIELVVGIALIILGFTFFNDTMAGHVFYVAFGAAVLVVWLFTDYKGTTVD